MATNKLSVGLAIFIATMLISGCSTVGQKSRIEQTEAINKVWPEKPAKARIAYVKSFTSPADLGISKGFFERIVDFITGGTDLRLVRPMAVLATEDGKIYVADPGSNAVHRFDTTNGKHKLIQIKDKQAFISPTGLAIGSQGDVYVTDSSLAQVYVIPAGADTASALNLKVSPDQPTNIVVNQKNRHLYVVDSARHHIKVYDHDGSLINTIGQRGTGEGEFNFPSMIWLDQNDHLLVSDALNFRVQIFDLDGRFIRQFGQHGDGTGDMSRPKGVATDVYGHIYVADALFHNVQVFNSSGKFLLSFGRQGNTAGEFLLPTGVYVSRDNMIYVADSHNSRIQMFRYIGERP